MTSPIISPVPTLAPSTTSGAPQNQLQGNDFMTLLLAQLRSQDPLQPMDPTQFVGQLVQFNSLDQLIAIHQLLTPLSQTTATGNMPPAVAQPSGK
jgi:flagellar basal-body rod modification protein FlgD